MKEQHQFAFSALLMLLAVAAGAFGAHGLRPLLEPRMLEVWETAVLYHLIHAIALLVIAALQMQKPGRGFGLAWSVMLGGLLLFSGSLSTIVLPGWRAIGPVTPLGGLTLMLSWLLVAWAGYRSAA